MSHNTKLEFWIKKCSFNILRPDELSLEGQKILELSLKADPSTFEECKDLLKDAITVSYLAGNVYELEDIFEDPDDEIEIEDFDIERIHPTEGTTIYFSLTGCFSVLTNRLIKSDQELRAIEEEFEGHFANGIQVDFNIFKEELEDSANDGDLSFSGHEGLGVNFSS